MTDKTNLQKQIELFKSQMKGVNESLYKFESQFEQEKAKIEKWGHSFAMTIKTINSELINSFDNANEAIKFILESKK
jgi:predicted  nucleic acid-binding Zn-ribbon protein